MKKIFGAEDSLLYADNNTSWANDLALELRYDFEFLYFQFFFVIFLVLQRLWYWYSLLFGQVSYILIQNLEIFDQK